MRVRGAARPLARSLQRQRLATSKLSDDAVLPETIPGQVPNVAPAMSDRGTDNKVSATSIAGDEAEGMGRVSVAETMTPFVSTEVRTYQSTIPPEQSQLLAAWVAEVNEGNLSAYKFGRILAELATTATPGWLESLQALVEQLSGNLGEDKLNAVVLAMISSVYFDQYGELSRAPNTELGSVLIPLELKERLLPAFKALRRFLTEANAMLPYIPGSGRAPVRTGTSPRNIQDIRVGQQSA